MTLERWVTLLVIISLVFYGHSVHAGSGCCSTHGGVAGCAGAKLQCNDGTLSPTCSCRDASTHSVPQAQDKLALMQAGTPEIKPNVIPIPVPSPRNTADIIPPREETLLASTEVD